MRFEFVQRLHEGIGIASFGHSLSRLMQRGDAELQCMFIIHRSSWCTVHYFRYWWNSWHSALLYLVLSLGDAQILDSSRYLRRFIRSDVTADAQSQRTRCGTLQKVTR